MNTKKPKEKNEGSSVSRRTCCCRLEPFVFLVMVFIVWIIINCMRSGWFGWTIGLVVLLTPKKKKLRLNF